MLAIGVGGADCGEAMAGLPWEVLHPKLVGVHLTGKLSGWTAPKDVITYLCTLLTVKGGTNKIIEYFGPGAESISATGKAHDLQHGRGAGRDDLALPVRRAHGRATCAPPSAPTWPRWPRSTARTWWPTPRSRRRPKTFYDEIVEINLDTLEPHVVGPHSPDRGRPISKLAAEVREPTSGRRPSPTRSSAPAPTPPTRTCGGPTHVAMQGLKAGLKAKAKFLVTPGSERIYQTIKRDGMIDTLSAIGGTVLANACGPCIGQWKRTDIAAEPAEHHRQLVQPQLPRAQRRQPGDAVVHHQPRIGDRAGLRRHARLQPAHRHAARRPTARRCGSRPPEGEELPRDGFARGAEGYEEPAADRRFRHASRSRPTASGCSCSGPSRRGTAGTSSTCRCW